MKYVKVNEIGEVIGLSDEMPAECSGWAVGKGPCPWARHLADEAAGISGGFKIGAGWLAAWDVNREPMIPDPAAFVEALAESASKFSGDKYLPIDNGEHCSPRYWILEAPKVGDEVSKGFNGDYYPVGKIVRISESMRVISVDGPRGPMKFYRHKNSGAWCSGPWGLVPGVRNELNPEF